MQIVVISPTHCCRAHHQTLEPSCSSRPITANPRAFLASQSWLRKGVIQHRAAHGVVCGFDHLLSRVGKLLEEIRPYLVGAAGGSLELVAITEPIVKVRITGPAAGS